MLRTSLSFNLPKKTDPLYLLSHFQQGVEGYAYHVCNGKGFQAVVKFFLRICDICSFSRKKYCNRGKNCKEIRNKEAQQRCAMEQAFWKKVNDIDVHIITLNKLPAMLMSYLEPLTEQQKTEFMTKTSKIHKAVATFILSFATKGYRQEDASWHHIGWYRYDGEPRLKLLDFGRVETVKTKKDKNNAIEFMMSNLQNDSTKRGSSEG